MLEISDIEDALEDRDLPQIEAAFSNLVRWPDTDLIGGAEDATDLAFLLDRVTAVLQTDRNPMPEDVVEGVKAWSGDDLWLRDDRSFAAGARAVAANSWRWPSLFGQWLGECDAETGPDPYATG